MPKTKQPQATPAILLREPIQVPEGSPVIDPFDIHGVFHALEKSFENPDAGIQPIEAYSSDYVNPRGNVDLSSPVITSVIANREIIEPVTVTIVMGLDAETGEEVANLVLVDGWTRLTAVIAYFLENPDDTEAFQTIPVRIVEGTPAELRTLATITNSARVNFDELATAANLHATLSGEKVPDDEIEDRVADFYRRMGQAHHSQLNRAMGLYRIAAHPTLHREVLAGVVDLEVALSAVNKLEDAEAALNAAKATMAAAAQKQAKKQHSGPVKADAAIKEATAQTGSKRSINEAKRELGLTDAREVAMNRKAMRTLLLNLHEAARLAYNAFTENEELLRSEPQGVTVDYDDPKYDNVRDYVTSVTTYQLIGTYTGVAICAGVINVASTTPTGWVDVAQDADLEHFYEAFVAMHRSLTKKERKDRGIGDYIYGLEDVDSVSSTEDVEEEEEEAVQEEAPKPKPGRKSAAAQEEAPKAKRGRKAAATQEEPEAVKPAKKKAKAAPAPVEEEDDLEEY